MAVIKANTIVDMLVMRGARYNLNEEEFVTIGKANAGIKNGEL